MAVVRLAETTDIPALPRIERSAAKAFRLTEHAWVADGEVTAAGAYPPLIAARSVWVAENDGVLVGFISTTRHEAELHVLELAVHLYHQRSGIGPELMEASIQSALDSGCAGVTLTTFRGVVWNAPFYRRLGFEALKEPPLYLSGILASEAARGLVDRCAMRLALKSRPNYISS
jgi:predicted N-acetyltransferase YhbS